MLLIESVNAISSKYPTTPETATDITIPHGARRRGSTVSSETLAEASYPVKVHIACNNPMMNAHQYGHPSSLLVMRAKKKLVGCFGAKSSSAPTITITPTM